LGKIASEAGGIRWLRWGNGWLSKKVEMGGYAGRYGWLCWEIWVAMSTEMDGILGEMMAACWEIRAARLTEMGGFVGGCE
jgi:hypothetical protein